MQDVWTIAMVKEQLPDAQVRIGKKVYAAHVSGRNAPFATVWLPMSPYLSWKFSWQAVARSLTAGTTLLV